MFKKKRIYLDWAAATPLSPAAFSAMKPFLTSDFGNPSAIHKEGAVALVAVEDARLKIARTLGIRENEVFFTGSGTEANNLAIYGLLRSLTEEGKTLADLEVITTAIEHPSVAEVLEQLQTKGLTVHHVPLDETGVIKTNELEALLNSKTCLVTFAYANSEIGTIQPVKRISRMVRKYNQEYKVSIKTHIDAAQAPLWLPCQLHQLGIDMMTLDTGKCCGPKGVGILAKLSAVDIKGVTLGGGQESGLRAGTENVAGIVGGADAFVEAQAGWKARANKVSIVRDQGIQYLFEEIEGAILNGSTGDDRLANNINISILGLDTEFATVVLDKHGFAVSTKSACSGAGGGASTVVKAISADPAQARPSEQAQARATSTLRLSLGPNTTLNNLKDLTRVLKSHIKQMKSIDK